MTAQHKTIGRRISAKDREFEELLRRAAVNAKSQTAANLREVPRTHDLSQKSSGRRSCAGRSYLPHSFQAVVVRVNLYAPARHPRIAQKLTISLFIVNNFRLGKP